MKDQRNQRRGILQQVVFVVRSFKSFVSLQFLSSNSRRRKQLSHIMSLEQMSCNPSFENIESDEKEKYCAYLNGVKNSKIEIYQDGKSSPTRNRQKIGDIIGIASR